MGLRKTTNAALEDVYRQLHVLFPNSLFRRRPQGLSTTKAIMHWYTSCFLGTIFILNSHPLESLTVDSH